jgi:dimethylhistidine N-methyltransferase
MNDMTIHRIIDRLHVDEAAELENLKRGLLAMPASIEPKYFYDELGCTLYAAICQLDEYYPTRTERSIFQQHRAEIAAAIGTGGTFIDLGAGDCCKALGWLPFIEPERYVAVDIAGPSLEVALSNMSPEFPDTEMVGLITDFSQHLEIPAELLGERITLFYPGSSIGNFAPPEALRFLREMHGYCRGGGLLIGVDAKKDKAKLDAAYADALGVTAAFNLNALRHINRVIGSDFVESNWNHVGAYDAQCGRIDMHLEARIAQHVRIGDRSRFFDVGERIHSESSYKYDRAEFAAMLVEAGFQAPKLWTDPDASFWVFHAQA